MACRKVRLSRDGSSRARLSPAVEIEFHFEQFHQWRRLLLPFDEQPERRFDVIFQFVVGRFAIFVVVDGRPVRDDAVLVDRRRRRRVLRRMRRESLTRETNVAQGASSILPESRRS